MECPKCGGRTYVRDSAYNPRDKELLRKRYCEKCGHVFFTVEFEAIHNKRFMRDWFLHHKAHRRP